MISSPHTMAYTYNAMIDGMMDGYYGGKGDMFCIGFHLNES